MIDEYTEKEVKRLPLTIRRKIVEVYCDKCGSKCYIVKQHLPKGYTCNKCVYGREK